MQEYGVIGNIPVSKTEVPGSIPIGAKLTLFKSWALKMAAKKTNNLSFFYRKFTPFNPKSSVKNKGLTA